MCIETPAATLLLPSTNLAPSAARDWLRLRTCPAHGTFPIDDALLLVSELVTNVVVHGRPPITVGMSCHEDVVRIHVRDGSPDLPSPRQAEPAATSGRGLALVEAIATAWGASPIDDEPGGGKEVWFELQQRRSRTLPRPEQGLPSE